jgi:GTPase KRas protein
VVIGSGGVGKSCLTLRFVRDVYHDDYDPTLEDAYRKQAKLDGNDVIFDIFDTAGQEEFSAVRDQYMRTTDGFLCVYDITRASSLREAENLYKLAIQLKDNAKVPFVLVGNKSDMAEEREVATTDGQKLAAKYGCSFFETSAKNNEHVQESFDKLAQLIAQFKQDNPGKDAGEGDKKKKKGSANNTNKSSEKRRCTLL